MMPEQPKITDNGNKYVLAKWPYIAGIIFAAGASITAAQVQIHAKPSVTDVQKIVEKEVREHAYEKDKGIRLEEQFKTIKRDLQEIKEILKEKLR